jgi:hypothetical protein
LASICRQDQTGSDGGPAGFAGMPLPADGETPCFRDAKKRHLPERVPFLKEQDKLPVA